MNRKQTGFTLIELMVVLAILAATATIALRTASSLQNQGRYQQTTRELNNIQSAIGGPSSSGVPNGNSLVSGFVADLGRLPNAYVSSNDPGDANGYLDPLNELLSQNSSMPTPQFYSSNTDNSVNIWVGWQGPYVQVGAGPSYIRDGWGYSLHCYDASGNQITAKLNTAVPNTPIAQIASWGASDNVDVNHVGTAVGTGAPLQYNYNDNVSIPNPTITTTTTGFVYQAAITGQVSMDVGLDGANSASGPTPNLTFTGTPVSPSSSPAVASVPVSIWVSYIGPDLTQSPNPVTDDPYLVDYSTESAWNSPWSGQYFISANSTPAYTNVTIGPRVLKVYVLPATVVNATGNNRTDFTYYVKNATTSFPIYATSTVNVNLVGGAQTINLTLPHYSP
jgi:prepilin-type N-terminal cleavage/methylation domain-containing protein